MINRMMAFICTDPESMDYDVHDELGRHFVGLWITVSSKSGAMPVKLSGKYGDPR